MGLNETVPIGVDPGYYYETVLPQYIGTGVLYIILSVSAVSLRFYARYVAGVGFWLDDYMALLVVPVIITNISMTMSRAPYGLGRHQVVLINTDPQLISGWFEHLFRVSIIYNISLAMFKCSVLALYHRFFFPYQWVRVCCISLSTTIVLWLITTVFIHVFRCDPIGGQSNMNRETTCILDLNNLYFITSIPSIVFSFLILLLPQPIVWQLQITKIRQILLAGIFLLGGFDVSLAIIRLISAVRWRNDDICCKSHSHTLHHYVLLGLISQSVTMVFPVALTSWSIAHLADNVPMFAWSVGEPTFGVLFSSMSTYGPFIRRRCCGGSSRRMYDPRLKRRDPGRSGKVGFYSLGDLKPAASGDDGTGGIQNGADARSDTVHLTPPQQAELDGIHIQHGTSTVLRDESIEDAVLSQDSGIMTGSR